MRVMAVRDTGYSDVVNLSPVYGGSTNAEDNTFAKATPGGSMELQIDNPTARGLFKHGQEYYVDLVPVPPVVTP